MSVVVRTISTDDLSQFLTPVPSAYAGLYLGGLEINFGNASTPYTAIEAAPIYTGFKFGVTFSGSRTRTVDTVNTWFEDVGTPGAPVLVERNYTTRVVTVETYTGTLETTFTRVPILTPTLPNSTVIEETNEETRFDLPDATTVLAAGECYMVLAASVGQRETFGAGFITDVIAIDPTRPVIRVLTHPDIYIYRNQTVGTRTVTYSVVSGTTPPGYASPAATSDPISDINEITFQAEFATIPDTVGARAAVDRFTLGPHFESETIANTTLDVSGWTDAKWRDYRGKYELAEVTWPLGTWDSSTVKHIRHITYLPEP